MTHSKDDSQEMFNLLILSHADYLIPMPDDSFKEFVLDQLGTLPELRARAMSGIALSRWLNRVESQTQGYKSPV